MKETIYRTPRSYGSPTGYDSEVSHFPDHVGRLAEHFLGQMLRAGTQDTPGQMAGYAVKLAEAFYAEMQARGHLLEVQDAPGMKKDYGSERGQS
jgi:hypothetical protein